jgi:hypothetical protein
VELAEQCCTGGTAAVSGGGSAQVAAISATGRRAGSRLMMLSRAGRLMARSGRGTRPAGELEEAVEAEEGAGAEVVVMF